MRDLHVTLVWWATDSKQPNSFTFHHVLGCEGWSVGSEELGSKRLPAWQSPSGRQELAG